MRERSAAQQLLSCLKYRDQVLVGQWKLAIITLAQCGGILCSEQASSWPACPTANTHNIVVGSRKSCLLRLCGLTLDYSRRPGRLRSKHKHKFAQHTRMATLCQDRIVTCLPMCEPIIWYRSANVLLQQAAPRARYVV